MTNYTGLQAIALAEQWTQDLGPQEDVFVYRVMEALLAHIHTQSKDIEALTCACQLLFRENRRLRDSLGNEGKKS